MAENLNVFWSSEAEQNLNDILTYIEEHWTHKEVENFLSKLDKCIFLIQNKPKLFPPTKQRANLRRCVLSKQTSLFYSYIESTIYIVALFDNRRDPSKL